MDNHWQEFRMVKSGKTHIWKVRQLGASYETMHGQLDGAMQTFSDTPGDKGVPNTKAYVSAEDNCAFHISREIRKKVEHGYCLFENGEFVQKQVTSLTFTDCLPKNFCGYKPKTSIEDKSLEKLHKTGKARYTRKYDGMCHLLVHHNWGWEVYTRRMDLTTDRFPNHIKELSKTNFEVGTILVGEMVCQTVSGRDDFKAISRVCRSLPEESRKLIENKECPEPTFFIFDMLWLNGIDLKDTDYDKRSSNWKSIKGNLIKSVEYFDVTPQTWQKVAKDNGWEGFVVTDGAAIPGDKFYSFDGDAKRPAGHSKLKPEQTEDVVVYAAALGSGKRLGKVGALFVKQIDPDSGKYFDCGKVGSGFTEEDIELFTKLCQDTGIPLLEKDTEAKKINLEKDSELVVELKFNERQEGTNKFRFPVYLRQRTDKTAKECIANL